ncbi:MAG TPA: hypothetical protein ENI24_05110 [Methylophaga sp.]|nr:hypothetical protein [Methylophaga sp.]
MEKHTGTLGLLGTSTERTNVGATYSVIRIDDLILTNIGITHQLNSFLRSSVGEEITLIIKKKSVLGIITPQGEKFCSNIWAGYTPLFIIFVYVMLAVVGYNVAQLMPILVFVPIIFALLFFYFHSTNQNDLSSLQSEGFALL